MRPRYNPRMKHSRPRPFSEISKTALRRVKILATDVDHTLTRGAEIPSQAFAALERLRDAGISVLLVTGRSYSWGLAEKLYFPVAGVIAENGGVWIRDGRAMSGVEFAGGRTIAGFRKIRERMRRCFEEIAAKIPGTTESPGHFAHVSDFVFPVQPGVDYSPATRIAERRGFNLLISSVACHITAPDISKGAMLEHVLRKHFGVKSFPTDGALTLGDSGNDAALFDAARFKLSVGVANVAGFLDALGRFRPAYITRGEAYKGFLEVARALLRYSQ